MTAHTTAGLLAAGKTTAAIATATHTTAALTIVTLFAASASSAPLFGQSDPTLDRSALARYSLAEPAADWRLPGRLREISGLALTSDGRLFAHDDERAIVYQVDYSEGGLVKAWALGDPPARADFEGIAVAGDRVWLVTSDGRLYEAGEGQDDDRVLYNTYETGVGRSCEVEGLEFEPRDETLLLVCKTHRVGQLQDVIAIYRWSIAERALVEPPILVRRAEIDRRRGVEGRSDRAGFNPSGIARDPATQNYFLVAARQGLLAEIQPDGTVVAVQRLGLRLHPQAEGIAVAYAVHLG